MLRALVAFFALSGAAFLLAPTVASMHEAFEGLNIHRDMPWRIWKWTQEPSPPDIMPPDCSPKTFRFESEVTRYPTNIAKNASFTLGGKVTIQGESRVLGDVTVDLFLNATKEKPGDLLGRTTTTADGRFELTTRVPQPLAASHYHIIAHALAKTLGCDQYREHWSDPEIDVTAKTRVNFELPQKVVIGREVVLRGSIIDEVRAPVRHANVTLTIDGVTSNVSTGANGSFAIPYTPQHEGVLKMSGAYAGNSHYSAGEGAASVAIVSEDLAVDGYDGSNPIGFTRGTPLTITGNVALAPGANPGPIQVTLTGVPLQMCPACPPTLSAQVHPNNTTGNYSLWVLAPSTGPGGPVDLTFSGGGLRESYAFPGIVRIPVTVGLESRASGFFAKSFVANASVRDEVGKALPLAVALQGPGGAWLGDGNEFAADAECGTHRLIAYYNGTSTYMPAQTQQDVTVCSYLAFLPAWVIGTPWWAWVLGGIATLALLVFGKWRFERAPSINRGPPLVLEITEPRDVVSEIVAPGENARLTAALEAPLPEGARLRLGAHRKMVDVQLDENLRAGLDFVAPESLGELALRGEIVDAHGRVITRRTIVLRVVRYAEEIEKRYKELRKGSVGETADVISPREFESWLRERAPTLDADVARRLVDIFEESDYGPREAGRRELLAFVTAELGVLEATPRVS